MTKKSIIVSIIGPTNAGKSTFLNRMIGKKISIVTPKVQTTRNVINGSCMYDGTHIIFLDTPGLFNAKNNLDRFMLRAAWSTISSSDMVILFFDGSVPFKEEYNAVLDRVRDSGTPMVICFNKSDKERRSEMQDAFYISCKNGRGITQLLDHIVPFARHDYIDSFKLTTMTMQFVCAEITREKLFLCLNHELPYNLKVQNEQLEKVSDHYYVIRQVIVTNSESHKKIILGSKGSMIKKVGIEAREEIERLYNIKLNLKLFVKVQSNWIDRDLSLDLEES